MIEKLNQGLQRLKPLMACGFLLFFLASNLSAHDFSFKSVTLHFLNKSTHSVTPVIFSKECCEYRIGGLRIRLLDAYKATEDDLTFEWVHLQIDQEDDHQTFHPLFKGWTNNYNLTFEHPEWFFKIITVEEDK